MKRETMRQLALMVVLAGMTTFWGCGEAEDCSEENGELTCAREASSATFAVSNPPPCLKDPYGNCKCDNVTFSCPKIGYGGTIDATCVTRWHQGAATTGGEWEWYSTCCTLATGYSYCWTAQNPTGSAVKPDPVEVGEPSSGGTTSGGSTADPN